MQVQQDMYSSRCQISGECKNLGVQYIIEIYYIIKHLIRLKGEMPVMSNDKKFKKKSLPGVMADLNLTLVNYSKPLTLLG